MGMDCYLHWEGITIVTIPEFKSNRDGWLVLNPARPAHGAGLIHADLDSLITRGVRFAKSNDVHSCTNQLEHCGDESVR
jgi:hypothetical protein